MKIGVPSVALIAEEWISIQIIAPFFVTYLLVLLIPLTNPLITSSKNISSPFLSST